MQSFDSDSFANEPSEKTVTQDKTSDSQLQNSKVSLSSQSNFIALQKLKGAEEHLNMMKRRLSVLKVKEDKNNLRYQTNLKKMSMHHSVQELQQMEKVRIREWKQLNEERVARLRIQNLAEKVEHHRKIEKVREESKLEKEQIFAKSKQEARMNKEKIQVLMKGHLEGKREASRKIRAMELNIRSAIDSFHRQKSSQQKSSKRKDVSHIEEETQKKEQMARQVSQIEMEMIERQSRSRLICEQSQHAVKEIFNPETKVRQRSSQELSKSIGQPQGASNSRFLLPEISSARKYVELGKSAQKGYFTVKK